MFGKKELGIMGAAALAACSPEQEAKDLSRDSSVLIEDEKGDTVITIAEEPPSEEGNAQYTAEQIEEILSGTTGEVDSMNTEQIEQLAKD
jgi:hypothetical protein